MKIVHASGKRKTAIARATLREGSGRVKINNIALEQYSPRMHRLKLMEPLLIADKFSAKVDISINVMGGGRSSQTEAARLAIAKAFVEYTKSDVLKSAYLEYDRNLLVADSRRRECVKPNSHSKARSKRQKSYR